MGGKELAAVCRDTMLTSVMQNVGHAPSAVVGGVVEVPSSSALLVLTTPWILGPNQLMRLEQAHHEASSSQDDEIIFARCMRRFLIAMSRCRSNFL